jgi:hypothetical protein
VAFIPPFDGALGALPRVIIDPAIAGPALLALAVLVLGFGFALHARQAERERARQERYTRLGECVAVLDEAIARCIEIEDRYTHPELRGAEHQSTFLTLRRELAQSISRARALVEVYGDLREPRIAGDAVAIAERPVFVASPDDTEVERSLPELRRLCVRMRYDQLDLMVRLRRRLDRKVWRRVLLTRR